MTSLCPGSVFSTVGFNRKSTPTSPAITPAELDQKYARQPYNGRPWPPRSPVSGVYDISNCSTKLILINNKQRKNSKLRGYSDPENEKDRYPDPRRHSRCSTPVNKELHHHCYNSQSPYYEPESETGLEWKNTKERPPIRFADGSAVNPRHHTSCLVPSDPKAFKIGMAYRRSAERPFFPRSFRSDPLLVHPELTAGEKRYLSSIARIYSADHMKRLKQYQYNQLLLQEMEKGFYTMKEYEQYRRFIDAGRRRQYMEVRAASAPPRQEKTRATPTNEVKSAGPEKTKRPYSVKSNKSGTSSGRSSVKGDKSGSIKSKSDKKSSSDASTLSDSDTVADDRVPMHREGVDRPKSRLGHSPRAARRMKNKISNDRYSSSYTSQSESEKSETDKTKTQSTTSSQSSKNKKQNTGTKNTNKTQDTQKHTEQNTDEKKSETENKANVIKIPSDQSEESQEEKQTNRDGAKEVAAEKTVTEIPKEESAKGDNSEGVEVASAKNTETSTNQTEANTKLDSDANAAKRDTSDEEPTHSYKTDTFTSDTQSSQQKTHDKTQSSQENTLTPPEPANSSLDKSSNSQQTKTDGSSQEPAQKSHDYSSTFEEYTLSTDEHTYSSQKQTKSDDNTYSSRKQTNSEDNTYSSRKQTDTEDNTYSSRKYTDSEDRTYSSRKGTDSEDQTYSSKKQTDSDHTYSSKFEDQTNSSQKQSDSDDRTLSSKRYTDSEPNSSQQKMGSEDKKDISDTVSPPLYMTETNDNINQNSTADAKDDDKKQNISRKDSLDSEIIDTMRRVNKDVDKIEY